MTDAKLCYTLHCIGRGGAGCVPVTHRWMTDEQAAQHYNEATGRYEYICWNCDNNVDPMAPLTRLHTAGPDPVERKRKSSGFHKIGWRAA